MQDKSITLRPMRDTAEDYNSLCLWFCEPELREWVWCDEKNEPPVALERVVEKYRPRIVSPDDVFPYFILLDGSPIGFIQYYMHGGHSAGIDMWIGSPCSREKASAPRR